MYLISMAYLFSEWFAQQYLQRAVSFLQRFLGSKRLFILKQRVILLLISNKKAFFG